MFLSTWFSNWRSPPQKLDDPTFSTSSAALVRDLSNRAQTQPAPRGASISANALLAEEVQVLKERLNVIVNVLGDRGIGFTLDSPHASQPAESLDGRAGPALDPDYVDVGNKGKNGPIRL
jgi:hypothetical protein